MKCVALIVFFITLNVVLSSTLRHKRQSSDNENNLDDRYGWDRPQPSWNNQPRPRPQRPQIPQRPNQGGNQWPGFDQGGNQWQIPQRPNQGGNQWPGFDQGGNQWQQGGNQFPNQGGNGQNQQQNQFPGQNQGGQPRPTPTPNGNGSTTESDAVQQCIRNCAVTSEYNPVCGTNMVQYPNPGRLMCAQNCGVNVSLFRASSCPVTTTAAPAT